MDLISKWNRSLSAAAIFGCVVFIALGGFAFVLTLLVNGPFAGEIDWQSLVGFFNSGEFLIYLALGWLTVSLMGFYFSSTREIRKMDPHGTPLTPGWSIGGWFIPIGALWLPFQAMSGVVRASRSGATTSLGWGWATYLMANVALFFAGIAAIGLDGAPLTETVLAQASANYGITCLSVALFALYVMLMRSVAARVLEGLTAQGQSGFVASPDRGINHPSVPGDLPPRPGGMENANERRSLKFCTQCGTAVAPNSSFCASCGQALSR